MHIYTCKGILFMIPTTHSRHTMRNLYLTLNWSTETRYLKRKLLTKVQCEYLASIDKFSLELNHIKKIFIHD